MRDHLVPGHIVRFVGHPDHVAPALIAGFDWGLPDTPALYGELAEKADGEYLWWVQFDGDRPRLQVHADQLELIDA